MARPSRWLIVFMLEIVACGDAGRTSGSVTAETTTSDKQTTTAPPDTTGAMSTTGPTNATAGSSESAMATTDTNPDSSGSDDGASVRVI